MIGGLELVLADRFSRRTNWPLKPLAGDAEWAKTIENGPLNDTQKHDFENYLIYHFSPSSDAEITRGEEDGNRKCMFMDMDYNDPCGVHVKHINGMGGDAPEELRKNGEIADIFSNHKALGLFAAIYNSKTHIVMVKGFSTMLNAIQTSSWSTELVDALYVNYFTDFIGGTTAVRPGMARAGLDAKIWYTMCYASKLKKEEHRDRAIKCLIDLHSKMYREVGDNTRTCLDTFDLIYKNLIVVNGGSRILPIDIDHMCVKAIDGGLRKDFFEKEFEEYKISAPGAKQIYDRARVAYEKKHYAYALDMDVLSYNQASMISAGNDGLPKQQKISLRVETYKASKQFSRDNAILITEKEQRIANLASTLGAGRYYLVNATDPKGPKGLLSKFFNLFEER